VREHHELVFISVGGMVQRTSAGGISQQGRSATGVRVMNLKEDDVVSAIALVIDAVEPSDELAVDEPLAGPSTDGEATAEIDDTDGTDDIEVAEEE
jgi:DNA gyrase subunit A